jgi:protein-disulfide isomerase
MISQRLVLPFVALGLAALTGAARPTPSPRTAAAPAVPDSAMLARADQGRILGSPTAKVWLVEASDFQCPFCKQWHDQSYATVLRDYVNTGKVRLAFLNDPLSMHQHAMQAAEAAMCASAQGKFWEMHEALFGSQTQWEGVPDPSAFFESLAGKAGVDMAAWKNCVSSHATRPLIQADQTRLRASGVQATPTFFVGSTRMEGVQPLAEMRKALDAALAAAGTR